MDNDTLRKLSLGISILWIAIMLIRVGTMSMSATQGPGSSGTSTLLVDIILIIGIVFIAVLLWMSYGKKAVAKVGRGEHCPQCYAKMEPGQEFCLKCGRRRDEGEEGQGRGPDQSP